jgi:hypothetical protein
MNSTIRLLLPLAVMGAGVVLAMALIAAVVSRLEPPAAAAVPAGAALRHSHPSSPPPLGGISPTQVRHS